MDDINQDTKSCCEPISKFFQVTFTRGRELISQCFGQRRDESPAYRVREHDEEKIELSDLQRMGPSAAVRERPRLRLDKPRPSVENKKPIMPAPLTRVFHDVTKSDVLQRRKAFRRRVPHQSRFEAGSITMDSQIEGQQKKIWTRTLPSAQKNDVVEKPSPSGLTSDEDDEYI